MSDIQTENTDKAPASALDGILSNPEALSTVLSVLKPSDNPAPSKEGPDILSGLLSNPEMLSKLPSMIETVKPLLQNLAPSASESKDKSVPPKKKEHDRRIALLLALKPYLSQSKCDAIDYIVKISGITELFR